MNVYAHFYSSAIISNTNTMNFNFYSITKKIVLMLYREHGANFKKQY